MGLVYIAVVQLGGFQRFHADALAHIVVVLDDEPVAGNALVVVFGIDVSDMQQSRAKALLRKTVQDPVSQVFAHHELFELIASGIAVRDQL